TDAGEDAYAHTIPAVDLTGKSWFEYTLTASDGTNVTTLEAVRVPVRGASADPLRLNLAEGQYVGGAATDGVTNVVAAGEKYPAEIELDVDGSPLESEASLESEPMFAFETSDTNYYFKNGVLV